MIKMTCRFYVVWFLNFNNNMYNIWIEQELEKYPRRVVVVVVECRRSRYIWNRNRTRYLVWRSLIL